MTNPEFAVPCSTYEITLGGLAETVDFDPDYFAAKMRGGGMSEEAIASTTFHFAYETPIDEDNGTVTTGEYDYDTNTIICYLDWRYDAANTNTDAYLTKQAGIVAKSSGVSVDEVIAKGIPPAITEWKSELVSYLLNRQINETLHHETDHCIEANTLSQEAYNARYSKYRDKVYSKRDAKEIALVWAACGALIVPMAGLKLGASPELMVKALAGGVAVAGVLSVIGQRMANKLRAPFTHKEYLRSPWEISARTYAAEHARPSAQPVNQPFMIKAKPLPFSKTP